MVLSNKNNKGNGLRLAVWAVLACALGAVAAAPTMTLDGVWTGLNDRLAAAPKRACVGGVTTEGSPVTSVRLSVAGMPSLGDVANVVPRTDLITGAPLPGGTFLVCLKAPVTASTVLYDATVQGLATSSSWFSTATLPLPGETIVLKDASFGFGLVLDGQSNMAAQIGLAKPEDLVITNYTRVLQELAKNRYYNTTFMYLPSGSTAAFSAVPTNVFPAVGRTWTRANAPGFDPTMLIKEMGWLSVLTCIEHARRNGPTHCLQIAVVTTRIAAHMSRVTYSRSAMTTAAPFTSVGSESLQQSGGLWYGAVEPALRWQADWWPISQGEKDYGTPDQYAVSLVGYLTDLRTQLARTRDAVGYTFAPGPSSVLDWLDVLQWWSTLTSSWSAGDRTLLKDRVIETDAKRAWRLQTSTIVSLFTLHMYQGFSVVPSSKNPPFNATAKAQRIAGSMDWDDFCLIESGQFGHFTLLDGGLHWMDTKGYAAVEAVRAYANVIKPDTYVTKGPSVRDRARLVAFDAATGAVSIAVDFDTPTNPTTGAPLGIAFAPVARPAATPSTIVRYTQFNGTQWSAGVAQPSSLVVTTAGPTATFSFPVQRPEFGPPTTLVYDWMSDFAQNLIANDPAATLPHPLWPNLAPQPALPFSVPVVVAV